jgi:hypothetical protein
VPKGIADSDEFYGGIPKCLSYCPKPADELSGSVFFIRKSQPLRNIKVGKKNESQEYKRLSHNEHCEEMNFEDEDTFYLSTCQGGKLTVSF